MAENSRAATFSAASPQNVEQRLLFRPFGDANLARFDRRARPLPAPKDSRKWRSTETLMRRNASADRTALRPTRPSRRGRHPHLPRQALFGSRRRTGPGGWYCRSRTARRYARLPPVQPRNPAAARRRRDRQFVRRQASDRRPAWPMLRRRRLPTSPLKIRRCRSFSAVLSPTAKQGVPASAARRLSDAWRSALALVMATSVETCLEPQLAPVGQRSSSEGEPKAQSQAPRAAWRCSKRPAPAASPARAGSFNSNLRKRRSQHWPGSSTPAEWPMDCRIASQSRSR